MVASEATNLACRSLQLDSIVTRAEKLTSMDNQPNLSREVNRQWAGSRETTSTFRSRQNFFLTSLFVELIENWVNECYQSQQQVIPSAHSMHPEGGLRRTRSPSIPVALFHSESTL